MCGFYICIQFTRSRYNNIHDYLLSPLPWFLVVFLVYALSYLFNCARIPAPGWFPVYGLA